MELKNTKVGLAATVYLEEIATALTDGLSEEDLIQFTTDLFKELDDDVLVSAIFKLLLVFVQNPSFKVDEFYRLSASLTAVVDWCHKMEGTDTYKMPTEEQHTYILETVGAFNAELDETAQEADDHRKLIIQKTTQGLYS